MHCNVKTIDTIYDYPDNPVKLFNFIFLVLIKIRHQSRKLFYNFECSKTQIFISFGINFGSKLVVEKYGYENKEVTINKLRSNFYLGA